MVYSGLVDVRSGVLFCLGVTVGIEKEAKKGILEKIHQVWL